MKSRMFLFMSIFLLSVTFSFAGGAKDKISEKDFWNALSGTWVNTEYTGKWRYYEQKLIVYPDGKYEYYPLTTDTNPSRQGYYFTFTEAWIDSEGVIWYKGEFQGRGTFYVLGKISESGNTWESIADGVEKPTEWDTTKTRYEEYGIRYRQ